MSNLTDARDRLGEAHTLALSLRSQKLQALRDATIGSSKDARLTAEREYSVASAIVTSIDAAQSSLEQVT